MGKKRNNKDKKANKKATNPNKNVPPPQNKSAQDTCSSFSAFLLVLVFVCAVGIAHHTSTVKYAYQRIPKFKLPAITILQHFQSFFTTGKQSHGEKPTNSEVLNEIQKQTTTLSSQMTTLLERTPDRTGNFSALRRSSLKINGCSAHWKSINGMQIIESALHCFVEDVETEDASKQEMKLTLGWIFPQEFTPCVKRVSFRAELDVIRFWMTDDCPAMKNNDWSYGAKIHPMEVNSRHQCNWEEVDELACSCNGDNLRLHVSGSNKYFVFTPRATSEGQSGCQCLGLPNQHAHTCYGIVNSFRVFNVLSLLCSSTCRVVLKRENVTKNTDHLPAYELFQKAASLWPGTSREDDSKKFIETVNNIFEKFATYLDTRQTKVAKVDALGYGVWYHRSAFEEVVREWEGSERKIYQMLLRDHDMNMLRSMYPNSKFTSSVDAPSMVPAS